MSSPGRDVGILPSSTEALNGSPVTIRRRPSLSASEISELTSRPRHSPVIPRSFDPNDPDARERQRTMDVDIAMHLSRARRETLIASPNISPYVEASQSPAADITTALLPISALSEHEERQIDIARGEISFEEPGERGAIAPTAQSSMMDLNSHQIQDTAPPQTLPTLNDCESAFGPPVYQDNVSRTNFDFAPLEQFAAVEKVALGLSSPTSPKFSLSALRHTRSRPRASTSSAPLPDDDPFSDSVNDAPPTMPLPHRKLSESNPNPRIHHRRGIGGKIALFEGSPNYSTVPNHLLNQQIHRHPQDGPSSYLYQTAPPPEIAGTGSLHTGHDRPYRFSFYSNTLAATIHTRSLSELPADGQTFEDLFSGVSPGKGSGTHASGEKQGTTRPLSSASFISRPATALGHNKGPATMNNSLDSSYFNHGGSQNALRKSDSRNGFVGGGGGGNGKYDADGDSDAKTWWLDILSPTDEEMKMLSKVFSIHPLTTEDIQMEETREKIELFRNYFLVCFRSFDQDQYSPTYLEPLNMYIIVFREGILSFHFRPTPHPQNVRRRIKQLKDYINVTSDWISYALIDDITDAFGPLIQSIEYEVDSIDDLVLILKEAEQSDMLRRIGTCRKKVMGLLRLMGNKADVVKGLAKRCNENWRVAPTSDIGLYLSDIQDHLITMTQNLNHYEKILSRSHSNYLAQISIEMTDANNQINDVLSKLTALGTVLIPMNLVTGLWGMNVHVPGQDIDGYVWFISIIAGLAAFALIGGYSTYKFMIRRNS